MGGRRFSPCAHDVSFECHGFQTISSLKEDGVRFDAAITGTAVIEATGIEVIGRHDADRTLHFSLRSSTPEGLIVPALEELKQQRMFIQPIASHASMNWYRHVQSDRRYYLAVTLTDAAFSTVLKAVREGRVARIHLMVAFTGLYTTLPWVPDDDYTDASFGILPKGHAVGLVTSMRVDSPEYGSCGASRIVEAIPVAEPLPVQRGGANRFMTREARAILLFGLLLGAFLAGLR